MNIDIHEVGTYDFDKASYEEKKMRKRRNYLIKKIIKIFNLHYKVEGIDILFQSNEWNALEERFFIIQSSL